jgi:hypothetical protein
MDVSSRERDLSITAHAFVSILCLLVNRCAGIDSKEAPTLGNINTRDVYAYLSSMTFHVHRLPLDIPDLTRRLNIYHISPIAITIGLDANGKFL